MLSTYASKLAARSDLSAADREALEALPGHLRTYAARENISSEERRTQHIGVMVAGFGSCFKIVNKGDRQITGFVLPGDAIDIPSILIGRPSAHILSNTASEVCWVKHDDLRKLCFERPNIATAIWLDTLIDAGVAQEWMANIGRRRARDRISHLFLEVAARQERIGATEDNTFELPLIQSDLACAVGLSLVHTNKSLRSLETSGLIQKKGNLVKIFDRKSLAHRIGFDPTYLWLGGTSAAAVPLLGSTAAEPVLPETPSKTSYH